MKKRRPTVAPLIFDRLCDERLFDPLPHLARHRLRKDQRMGRHDDLDGDGKADQADPPPGELTAAEHDAQAAEPGHIGDATGTDDGEETPS